MATITSLLDQFTRDRRGRGMRPAGVQRYEDCLKRVEKYMREEHDATHVRDITPRLLTEYRDHCMEERQNKASTVQKHLTAFRAFALWAAKQGEMQGDPTKDIAWPVVRKPGPKPLTPAELGKLWAILEAEPDGPDDDDRRFYHRRNRLVILLMYYAGLRLGEVARLRVNDVNLSAQQVTIRESKGRDRAVALHPDLVAALRLALEGRAQKAPVIVGLGGRPLKPEIVAKIFEAPRGWLPRRGLRISAHRLRHSFGTELLRASGNLGIVQEAMGHQSPETTRMYAQVTAEDQRPAIARIPRLSSFRQKAPSA